MFESVADLVAFVRTDNDNDLVDHPAWSTLASLSADELEPDDDNRYDLIGVPELVADKPTEDAVDTLRATLAIVASIGAVCELAPSTSSSTATRCWARCRAGPKASRVKTD